MTVRLSVMVFPGAQTLPLFAAQALGLFEQHGLMVDLVPAPNSAEQRAGLAVGRYQIAHGAADQCVALALTGIDAVVVAGGDGGFNHLFVQPEISSVAALRGKTLVADVADTGWSFVLYDILKRAGLRRGDWKVHEAGAPFRRFEALRDDKAMAAAILNPPFAIRARRAGLKDMGPVVASIGPYQGTLPYALRGWARDHADVLTGYLAAMIQGLRWVLDTRNRASAVALCAERLRLPDDIAAETCAAAIDPADGLAADAAIDLAGFENMLRLRAEFTETPLGRPQAYIDRTCYDRALALV